MPCREAKEAEEKAAAERRVAEEKKARKASKNFKLISFGGWGPVWRATWRARQTAGTGCMARHVCCSTRAWPPPQSCAPCTPVFASKPQEQLPGFG